MSNFVNFSNSKTKRILASLVRIIMNKAQRNRFASLNSFNQVQLFSQQKVN